MQRSHNLAKQPKLRAIIAEDEQPLAMVLEKALNTLWPELIIFDIFYEGRSAQQSLIDSQIDIAFLDIAMPYKTGLEVAEYCALNKIDTIIVLVTAYPQHALDAFKFNVCDYLLKPLCKHRLSETIERLKTRLTTISQSTKTETLKYLSMQKGNHSQLVNIDNVLYFVSEQKYVKVVTVDNNFLISKTLTELEKELDGKLFWRVHRNSIVNIKQILYSKKTLTGRLELTLTNSNEKLTVSRTYLHRFKAW
jgi:DNA-binding LytR/AlgR family response regulator